MEKVTIVCWKDIDGKISLSYWRNDDSNLFYNVGDEDSEYGVVTDVQTVYLNTN